MKIVCYISETARDQRLFRALQVGFRKHGEHVDVLDTHETTGPTPGYDLAVFVGVRTKGRHVWNNCKEAGQQFLMLDKGYFQRSFYHRFSVNSPQPRYFERMDYDSERYKQLNSGSNAYREVRRRDPKYVVYVEATQKYYSFHGLGHLSDYAELVCGQLNEILATHQRTQLQVVYRPKASARLEKNSDEKPRQPPNTLHSHPMEQPLSELLTTAHCVVVHGSNAGFEAMMSGVPVLTLGGPDANPLYDLVNTNLTDILDPKLPDPAAAERRAAQLAWCQFNDEEMISGLAWEHTKRWVRQ